MDHDQDWADYRRLVLAELERITGELKDHRKMIHNTQTEIAIGKAKSALIATFVSITIAGAGLIISWVK